MNPATQGDGGPPLSNGMHTIASTISKIGKISIGLTIVTRSRRRGMPCSKFTPGR